jgi:2-keto-3-deoxy-L-rhamnonate aldolase RhmA
LSFQIRTHILVPFYRVTKETSVTFGDGKMISTLKKRLAQGGSIVMLNPSHISMTLTEKLAIAGADLIFVDCESGTASYDQLQQMTKGARLGGGHTIARPQNQDHSMLARCLHCGADGLMVPLVNTADQAKEVVATVRYNCPDQEIDEKLIIVMIETTEAVRNLDEILAVDGIDIFFIGPGDLSITMGYSPRVPPGGRRPQPVLDMVEHIIARIHAAGKATGTLVTKRDIAHYAALGTQLLYYHVDPLLAESLQTMRELATIDK